LIDIFHLRPHPVKIGKVFSLPLYLLLVCSLLSFFFSFFVKKKKKKESSKEKRKRKNFNNWFYTKSNLISKINNRESRGRMPFGGSRAAPLWGLGRSPN
ncbi:MAG: hypothetical protein IKN43_15355, partial [Selenomonadaceae bacterium]|nr:hypothetical protein [Selenomonadaceae bacterium]